MFSFFSPPHSFFVSLSSNREGKKSKKLPHRNRWERERESEVTAAKADGDHPLIAAGPPPHHQVHANRVGSDRLLSLFFFFLHYFLVLIHFVVTICFMRTRLCFDYLSLFKVIWETKTRERNRGWERKDNFLLSWEFFLRMNIDLEFLHVKRATVATLKKKLELERLLEGVFCVFTLQNWL